MAKKTSPLLPSTIELLQQFGERLRLARLRRRLTAKQVSERAGMAPMTLRSLERGGEGVTMSAYLAVMQVLGMEKDLDLLSKADSVGRQIQDAKLVDSKRPRKASQSNTPSKVIRSAAISAGPKPDWMCVEGYANNRELADLVSNVALPQRKES
jgi:transcriptional regulator with XRE-family HTH domain